MIDRLLRYYSEYIQRMEEKNRQPAYLSGKRDRDSMRAFEDSLLNNTPNSEQFEDKGGLRGALNRYGLRRGKSLTYIIILTSFVTYLVCVWII
jgi:hypothetical protein|tara:strand:- start:667 stop:945 length:279 start_codon:yes stop_codon:yes gene_type:complete